MSERDMVIVRVVMPALGDPLIEAFRAARAPRPAVVHYLVSADPDARDGRGSEELTTDPEQAMRFADVGAALEYWRRQSTVAPFRDDGKPNRPLTAFTVELTTLAVALAESRR